MCVVQHYASITLTTVNAETVFSALKTQVEKDKIPLLKIISSLSDSAGLYAWTEVGLRDKVEGDSSPLA